MDTEVMRGRAKRRGYRLHRAVWVRWPACHALIDARTNQIVLGHAFDATLDEIEAFLKSAPINPTSTNATLISQQGRRKPHAAPNIKCKTPLAPPVQCVW